MAEVIDAHCAKARSTLCKESLAESVQIEQWAVASGFSG